MKACNSRKQAKRCSRLMHLSMARNGEQGLGFEVKKTEKKKLTQSEFCSGTHMNFNLYIGIRIEIR